MSVMGKWGGMDFTVSAKLICGFTNLSIKGSSKTEDKEAGSQSYVTRKSGNVTQITLTVGLSALVGATDVRARALWFVNNARAGTSDYFYVGSQKLFEKRVMLTDASVDKIELSPSGKWVSCDVKLTFRECEVSSDGSSDDGSNGGGSGGGGSGGGGIGGNKKKRPPKKVTVTGLSVIQSGISAAAAAVANKKTSKSIVAKGITAAAAVIKKANTRRKATTPVKKTIVKPSRTRNLKVRRMTK